MTTETVMFFDKINRFADSVGIERPNPPLMFSLIAALLLLNIAMLN